jgi:PASTA domain
MANTRDSGYARVPAGNIQVDFVWGNMPSQTNDDRSGSSVSYNAAGGGSGDHAWSTTTDYTSNLLVEVQPTVTVGTNTYTVPADNNVNNLNAWNGFPENTVTTNYNSASGSYWTTATQNLTGSGFLTGASYVTVPSVLGLTAVEADRVLGVADLNTGTVTYTASGATAANNNTVYSQSIAANAANITKGSTVNLVVYRTAFGEAAGTGSQES